LGGTSPAAANYRSQIFYAHLRILSVQYGVAIRTYRDEVADRIHLVFRSDIAYGHPMMNMDIAGTEVTVHIVHRGATDPAHDSVMAQAGATRGGITFISVKHDGLNSSLQERRSGWDSSTPVAKVVT
jgi:hypothetical protein